MGSHQKKLNELVTKTIKMKEKYHYVLGETSHGKGSNSVIWMVIVTTLLIIMGMGVMIGIVYNDHNDVRKRVEILEGEIMVLRDMLNKETILEFDRSRRDALYPNQYDVQSPIKENFSEYTQDGIPVVSRKYKGFAKDRTGFRVYNAWYKHRRENKIRNDPRVVVKHVTDAPIRPHHRKSAAWSGGSDDDVGDEDDFLDFGDSMYSDSNAATNSRPVNSVSYTRNRAKITNVQNYREENRNYNPTTTSTTPPTTQAAVKTSSLRTNLNDHMRSKMLEMSSGSASMRTGHGQNHKNNNQRGARNRMGLRSGGSAVESRKHVAAIHLEGEVQRVAGGGGSGGRIQLSDGVFRDWSVSRWARRMHMTRKIKLDQGVLTVGSPGIYFIYAQINYLDDHDVNAFQILVNSSPWLMCTTMTHTPRATTKANTCYTGGVRYLEQGDTLMVKNTDTNRFAVMLPSHSFFGLAQLSEMGM